ncbi:DUF2927 domain-containing protein [uncultured Thioclava sp.]|uniref:DUF2927 domain-containing protein n=1 Tax=uncultured Thioclava sp. TaxID=473858 RepID=UPI0025E03AE2|nr:DUF2927 domain-containing protein [uncultured Thioclava sp.]
MIWARALRWLTGLAGCLAVSGCVGLLGSPNAPRTTPRPTPAPAQPGASKAAQRSELSRELMAYYAKITSEMEARGQLRTDVAPRDAPFGQRQLVDDFVHVALYDEYTPSGGGFVARQTVSRLRRWQAPVAMQVEFGASIPMADRASGRAEVSAYASQLARASDHRVEIVNHSSNFHVLFLNEDERRAIGPRLRQLVPGIDEASVEAITDLPLSTYCVAFAFSEGNSAVYAQAVAIIRGEHPAALRTSCIHEELAQGLGLANDYPRARPSIFNDDEEFSLLTHHDEMLLKMLYDPRLRPGMTEAEARPIIETIAAEMMAANS